MGYKSTTVLSRAEAEHKYVELYIELNKNKFRAIAVAMSKKELEDHLEKMNDERYDDGEGSDRYLIIS